MKPICVTCARFYRPKKNGYYFIEGMPGVNDAPPGRVADDQWQDYKLWSGDVWQCLGCGAEVIIGTGREPIAVQHQPDFADTAARLGAHQFRVNDC